MKTKYQICGMYGRSRGYLLEGKTTTIKTNPLIIAAFNTFSWSIYYKLNISILGQINEF